jgi:hypothetical protein
MGPFGQTLVLYLLIGGGVAGALYLSGPGNSAAGRWFRLATALPFWPLYLPILLNRRAAGSDGPPPGSSVPPPPDEMALAIHQVDAELVSALASLDGWAEDVLAREKGRIRELRAAWTAQAARIRAMDRVLARPENAGEATEPLRPDDCADRLRASRMARRKNIDRLRKIRHKTYDDLMATLAWVRELVSMIHLAKFTGAPAARAEELVAQIAAAVEGLSETALIEDPFPSPEATTATS